MLMVVTHFKNQLTTLHWCELVFPTGTAEQERLYHKLYLIYSFNPLIILIQMERLNPSSEMK